MATGYIDLPAGGIPVYPSATQFPIVSDDGDQAVAADTSTIYVYDSSVPGWQAVATPGPAIAITALLGDVTATGPGAVNSTVNFVGSATAANVAIATADVLAATSSATPNTIAKRGANAEVSFGNVSLATAGNKLKIKEGTNASMGVTAAFPGTNPNTVTVNTTAVGADSRIFLSVQSNPGNHQPDVYSNSRVAGTSFTIRAHDVNFNGTVAWLIIDPA